MHGGSIDGKDFKSVQKMGVNAIKCKNQIYRYINVRFSFDCKQNVFTIHKNINNDHPDI